MVSIGLTSGISTWLVPERTEEELRKVARSSKDVAKEALSLAGSIAARDLGSGVAARVIV
jgi:hypothetical protein